MGAIRISVEAGLEVTKLLVVGEALSQGNNPGEEAVWVDLCHREHGMTALAEKIGRV